ncbi:hypothetical protein DH2020_024934 [Rehmannia glutinosa]|uniref:Rho GTPase-activating protein n=1 Tax=Rehmannia glutinosa TaxID=99300 RepID=A0ABR0W159_REHGL
MTGMVMVTRVGGCAGKSSKSAVDEELDKQEDSQNQLSLLDFILSALRKSMVSTCRVDREDQEVISAVHHMEIGWPTNVQHITHVTFDRFHGFWGSLLSLRLSVSVFGVSADSMQCSCDTRGNSVPTILLLMQERLYSQGGLKSEGIFRINPENSKEEHVRDQLNRGIVPEDIDVHCLAGLIKAWFRELPPGVLDGLSPEQVLQCHTEEDSVDLIKQLKPTENALLSWAVNLMADVVEQEESNKMNARNIAMMSDPLTALMHAPVQVMNLLKTLIMKTIRERDEAGEGGRMRVHQMIILLPLMQIRFSLSDSRIGSSFISTSDGEDSRMSSVAPPGLNMDKESHVVCKQALNSNLDMVDNMVES